MYHYIKSISNRIFTKNKNNVDNFRYREYLFLELMNLHPETFKNKRILEIGPRDGLDTFRLETLNPEEIIIMDLKNRTETLEVTDPPTRKAGVMVETVDELLEKLKNEAKVL